MRSASAPLLALTLILALAGCAAAPDTPESTEILVIAFSDDRAIALRVVGLDAPAAFEQYWQTRRRSGA